MLNALAKVYNNTWCSVQLYMCVSVCVSFRTVR